MSGATAEGGVLVQFRRLRGGSGEWNARIRGEQGRVSEVVHSFDRLSVSARWEAPAGALTCVFAYGGKAAWNADAAADPRRVRYVFLDSDRWRVSADIPAGCPMRPYLDLIVELPAAALPARLAFPDEKTVTLVAPRTTVRWTLPLFEKGVLASGEFVLVLEGKNGRRQPIVVGLDRDGTPAASLGYLENW